MTVPVTMNAVKRTAAVVAAMSAAATLLAQVAPSPQAPASGPALLEQVEAIRAEGKLPAVGAVHFTSGTISDPVVVGVRRIGDDTPVAPGDRWHVGSITKSFTATLVARAIERGVLSWDSTLGDLLGPARADRYTGVTVRHLLSHRSGLPANLPAAANLKAVQSNLTPAEQRQEIIQIALAMPPGGAPGERFLYSNMGYVVMGAVLEAKSGQPWEAMVRSQLLAPLGLTSAGFGPPGEPGALTEPRGHRTGGGVLIPIEPGPFADNPAFLGPAGTLHMTVEDLARWGQAHLRGALGQDGLVTAESFRTLHTPPAEGADYAMGWVVRTTGARRVLWHNGSNTLWYAVVAFDPGADFGVAVVTNGSIDGRKPIDARLADLLRRRAAR